MSIDFKQTTPKFGQQNSNMRIRARHLRHRCDYTDSSRWNKLVTWFNDCWLNRLFDVEGHWVKRVFGNNLYCAIILFVVMAIVAMLLNHFMPVR